MLRASLLRRPASLLRRPKIGRCVSPRWRPPCLHLIARPRRPAPARTAAPRGSSRPGGLRRGRTLFVSTCACELVGSKAASAATVAFLCWSPVSLPLICSCACASTLGGVLVQMSSILKLDRRWRTRWVAGTHSESTLYIVTWSSKCTRALTFENVSQSPTAHSSTGRTRRISGVERPTKGINPETRTIHICSKCIFTTYFYIFCINPETRPAPILNPQP